MMFLCAFSVAGVSCSVLKSVLKALGWGLVPCRDLPPNVQLTMQQKTALGSGKSFGSHRSFHHETLPQLWHLFLAPGGAGSQMHPYVFLLKDGFITCFKTKW